MTAPAPDAKHTQIVGLDFRIEAIRQAIKDKRAKFNAEAQEATKIEREELRASLRRRAEMMADVAQQWLAL